MQRTCRFDLGNIKIVSNLELKIAMHLSIMKVMNVVFIKREFFFFLKPYKYQYKKTTTYK